MHIYNVLITAPITLQSCGDCFLTVSCFLLVYGAVHLQHQGGNIVSYLFFPNIYPVMLAQRKRFYYTHLKKCYVFVQNVSCFNCLPDVLLLQLFVGILIYSS